MTLEYIVCSECGAEFHVDPFAEHAAEMVACPRCGTVALGAEPVEDVILHIHRAVCEPAEPELPRLTA